MVVAGATGGKEIVDEDRQLRGRNRGLALAYRPRRLGWQVVVLAKTPGPRAAIRREYGWLGWFIPRALAHCPPPAGVYDDQVAQIEMPPWSQDRVTGRWRGWAVGVLVTMRTWLRR